MRPTIRRVVTAVLLLSFLIPLVPTAPGLGSGQLAPPHADVAEDRDVPADGLYNVLRVDVRVNIASPGSFEIRAVLWDSGQSSMIDSQVAFADLSSGPHTVPVYFLGLSIRGMGISGPYVVALYLRVIAPGTGPVQLDYGTHTTASYSFSQFQGPSATVQGVIRDSRTSAPIVLASAEAYSYRDDAFVVATLTGPSGAYTLNLYPGDWVLVFDAWAYQAEVRTVTVTGSMTLSDARLPSTPVSPVTYWVSFSTWNAEVSRVLGVGVDDNASFRLVGDFRFGNRDQALTIDEFNRTLSDPNMFAPPKWSVFAGLPPRPDSRYEFSVDGKAFDILPGSDTVRYSNFEGPLYNTQPPQIDRTVPRVNATVTTADAHAIAVNVTYENTMNVGYTGIVYFVQLPPLTLLASYTPTPSITVTDLGAGLIQVDPGSAADAWPGYAWITLNAVRDRVPPAITSPRALPDPVELGQSTTVETDVSDYSGVASVNISIRDPGGASVGNLTMTRGTGNVYRHTFLPTQVGTYTFNVTAWDAAGNSGVAPGSVFVEDTTAPAISAVWADPNPVELGGSALVEAVITDLGGVASASVDIRDPYGMGAGPVPMSRGTGDTYQYSFLPPLVGTYSFEVTAADPSANLATASGSFTVQDTTPPTIASLRAVPSPAEIGQDVSVEATVTDPSGVASVVVEIRDPSGAVVAILPMTRMIGDAYRSSFTPLATGTYTFAVTAVDARGNSQARSDGLAVQDTTPPSIASAAAVPDPVEIGGSTSIEARVTDPGGVASVTVEIRDPAGVRIGNITMTWMGGDTYRLATTPTALGTYSFIVFALDLAGNLAELPGTITVRDTVAPTANAGLDRTVPQHSLVTLDGSASSDNHQIVNFTWTFDDGGPRTLYGDRPAYRFDRAGVFDITLVVRDEAGNQASDTVRVTTVSGSGTIRGTVRESSGAMLPGATVHLLDGSQEVAVATTDGNGAFEFQEVSPGPYTLAADLAGFDGKAEPVSVTAGETATKDIVLTRTAGTSLIQGWVIPVIVVAVVVITGSVVYVARRRSRKRVEPPTLPKGRA